MFVYIYYIRTLNNSLGVNIHYLLTVHFIIFIFYNVFSCLVSEALKLSSCKSSCFLVSKLMLVKIVNIGPVGTEAVV